MDIKDKLDFLKKGKGARVRPRSVSVEQAWSRLSGDDGLSVKEVQPFKKGICEFINNQHPEIAYKIRQEKVIDAVLEGTLSKAIRDYLNTVFRSETAATTSASFEPWMSSTR